MSGGVRGRMEVCKRDYEGRREKAVQATRRRRRLERMGRRRLGKIKKLSSAEERQAKRLRN